MNEQEQTKSEKVNIFRTVKTENPFAQIDKRLINDKSISWKTKGILIYLLSKPNDWTAQITDIINHATDGRDAIRSAIKEAVKAGYIKRIQYKNKKGQFAGLEYQVYETPINTNTKDVTIFIDNDGLTESGKPDFGLPEIGKSPTNNNDFNNNDSNNIYLYIQNKNLCPNCKSEVRIKNKRSGDYDQVLFCETCKCEFLPPTETEQGEILKKGTDFEAIQLFNDYYANHPNADDVFYEKQAALKIFQSLLNRCRNNGKENGEAYEIVKERMLNFFENEYYEKTNWMLESLCKNFNQFAEPHYESNEKFLN